MKHKNLILLGTSHIARQSIIEVENAIEKENPSAVALELDPGRLHSLLAKEKPKPRLRDIRMVGLKGYIFSMIGAWAEKKLGESVGVSPGAEMKKAYETAKSRGINILLIDQDISITLQRISKSITWKEKWHFLADAFSSFVLRKKIKGFDLRKVPSEKMIKLLVSKVKVRYPNIYKVLVTERNSVMAKNLAKYCRRNPDAKVLAVVGAGHEKEILGIFREELKKPAVSYTFAIS